MVDGWILNRLLMWLNWFTPLGWTWNKQNHNLKNVQCQHMG